MHDKGVLAILERFGEWKHYRLGADDPGTVYNDQKSLQYLLTTILCKPRQIRWAPWLANFNCTIVDRPLSRGGKPNALSQWPEYSLEEGATHCQQMILKPEQFEVSRCHRKDRIHISLVEGKKRTTNRLRIKRLQQNVIIPTKGSRMAAGHDIYAPKGCHHTSPRRDVNRYQNCTRTAQWNIRQAGGKMSHGNQTVNSSRGIRKMSERGPRWS